jgi:AmiR/NasT family two-component response regulator
MCHEAMTEAAAQRWLQRTAIHRRVKLTRVSTAVIERWSSGPGPVELGTITAR